MMKRLFCILLSLMLMASASLVLAEDADAAAVEAPAEASAEPVLLATVNGKEINTDDYGYQAYLAYNLNTLAQYGLDESMEEYPLYRDVYSNVSLSVAVLHAFYAEQAEALGLQLEEGARTEYENNVRDYWQSVVDSYVQEQGITGESSAEDREAAIADAQATILNNYGYTEDSFLNEQMQEYDYFTLEEDVKAELTKDLSATEEELQSYFNDLVKEDQEAYENNIMNYEQATQIQPSYYIPEGYRSVTHILLPVDQELLNTWIDLTARLEEQKSDKEAEATGTEQPAEAEATPAPDSVPAEEPVSQEMIDAAEQAILDSVQPTVDEIMEKLDSGTSFDDLIKEYGTDPGMQDDATRAEGYQVHPDSIRYIPAFTKAAMELEKVGDVGKPVVSQYGVHILQYLKDIPGGAVEFSDDIRSELTTQLLEEAKEQKLNDLFDAWKSTADIQYTDEGQKIIDAAEAAYAVLMGTVEQDSTEAPDPAE